MSVREFLEDIWRRYDRHEHAFIFIEDMKVDGEKEVVCGVCDEEPLGPGYKCSVCNFFCHQSCFELPQEIHHPLHPNHTFLIQPPLHSRYCYACGKCCQNCMFYRCEDSDCDFNIDTKCFYRWRANKDDCHQHTYIPFLKQIQFTCEACGEEGKDIGCLCSTCQLLIHAKCVSFSRTIKILDHDHLLTLTYSIGQVKEHAKILCNLCYEEVNTKYAAYCCQECSYYSHLRCTRWHDLGHDRNSIIGSNGHITHFINDINRARNESGLPMEFKHFSHQHDLVLNYEEVKGETLCDGCMQLISPPFYSCMQCNFFLHNICAKLPINATYPHIPYTSTLLSQVLSSDGVFTCAACEQYRHGFCYNIGISEEYLDIHCFAIKETLQHEVHQHPLFLVMKSHQKCKFCKKEGNFICSLCDFVLCYRCSTLPLVANYKYDKHLLKLTYTATDESGEKYCLICEKERDTDYLFYYCAECDFPAHSYCVLGKYPYIKFGKTYKDEHHQHPLTFVQKSEYSPPCDVCKLPFNEVALECTQCKLSLHPRFGSHKKDCLQELDKRWGKE